MKTNYIQSFAHDPYLLTVRNTRTTLKKAFLSTTCIVIYYIHSMFKSLTTQWCVARRESEERDLSYFWKFSTIINIYIVLFLGNSNSKFHIPYSIRSVLTLYRPDVNEKYSKENFIKRTRENIIVYDIQIKENEYTNL